MYGTVARVRANPGAEERFMELSRSYEALDIPGFVGTLVYRLDSDPQEHMLVVLFEDRDSYRRNADDPAQDARFREMLGLLESEPEWHDGEVVYASGALGASRGG